MILIINDRIENKQFDFFNSFRLTLKYDSMASDFSFNFVYNPDKLDRVELAQVGHYHIAKVEHNGEQLLEGYLLSQGLTSQATQKMSNLSGYSLPGVLEDCNIDPSSYPLQYDKLNLSEIAKKLIDPFGLQMVVDSAVRSKMNVAYETISAKPTQTIKQFLSELASQRNIIISHDEKGRLRFTQINPNTTPIIEFDTGKAGSIPATLALAFNGQGMHSDITAMKQASASGGNAGQSTVKNPYVPFVFRPKVVIQNSGDDNDTNTVAKMALAQELKNIKLTVTTNRWDVNGVVIKPNNYITVREPKLSLFTKSTWFIESVELAQDAEKQTAKLTCVPPEVYNGNPPEYIFKLH